MGVDNLIWVESGKEGLMAILEVETEGWQIEMECQEVDLELQVTISTDVVIDSAMSTEDPEPHQEECKAVEMPEEGVLTWIEMEAWTIWEAVVSGKGTTVEWTVVIAEMIRSEVGEVQKRIDLMMKCSTVIMDHEGTIMVTEMASVAEMGTVGMIATVMGVEVPAEMNTDEKAHRFLSPQTLILGLLRSILRSFSMATLNRALP